MGSSTGVRYERQEVSSTVSPRVEGSSPVRGKFFAEFFSLIQFWQIWQNDLFQENLEWIAQIHLQLVDDARSIVASMAANPHKTPTFSSIGWESN